MNSRELFLQRRFVEHPVFLKVLRALAKDQNDRPTELTAGRERSFWGFEGFLLLKSAAEDAACGTLR
jgi:hypothetical protein